MTSTSDENCLEGLRLLIVEDRLLIAQEVSDMVERLGCRVVGMAGRVESALGMIEQIELDGALLDVNLDDQTVAPVAESLDGRSIPFVFTTGYGSGALPAQFRNRALLTKPFSSRELSQAIQQSIVARTC